MYQPSSSEQIKGKKWDYIIKQTLIDRGCNYIFIIGGVYITGSATVDLILVITLWIDIKIFAIFNAHFASGSSYAIAMQCVIIFLSKRLNQ